MLIWCEVDSFYFWEVVWPFRIERSKTGALGHVNHCLNYSLWGKDNAQVGNDPSNLKNSPINIRALIATMQSCFPGNETSAIDQPRSQVCHIGVPSPGRRYI